MSPSLRSAKVRLVAMRDLREATGDVRLISTTIALSILVPVLAALAVRLLAYADSGARSGLEAPMSLVGAFFVTFLPATFSLVLALESFVGEKERGTLEVLLAAPLRDREIYAGKALAVLAVSLTLSLGGLTLYSLLAFPGLVVVPWQVLVVLAVTTVCEVLVMVSGAVMISMRARTMRAANVMASLVILPVASMLQIEAGLVVVDQVAYLWYFASAFAVIAFALTRMGLKGFNREAMLARESGPFNLGRALRGWWREGRSAAVAVRPHASVGSRLVDGFAVVWQQRAPVLLGFALTVIAVPVGYLAGSDRLLQPGVVQLLGMASAHSTSGAQLVAYSASLFVVGLFTLLAAFILFPPTLGISGGLLSFMPGFSLGFTAAVTSWSAAVGTLFPHLIVEIPLVAVAGGLILRCGAAMLHVETENGWLYGVKVAARDYLRVMVLLVPLAAISAMLQAGLAPPLG